jgi:c-di-GMP-binding flagellar brake protein YcgR
VDAQNNVRDIFALGANFALYKPISPERVSSSMKAARALMRRERRTNPRAPVHAQASIAFPNREDAKATLVDLSEYGLAIQAEHNLPPRSKVYFQFSVPGQTAVVRFSGEVVWQDASGRVGLRFADMPSTSRRALNQWLDTNLAEHSKATADDSDSLELIVEQSESDTQPILAAGLESLSNSLSERRIQSRQSCCVGAEVYKQGSRVPNRCNLSDISTGGCYVETTTPFPSGTQVEIRLHTEDLKLSVQGAVQAFHPGFGMGVRFSLKTADQRRQVKELIARQAAEAEKAQSADEPQTNPA